MPISSYSTPTVNYSITNATVSIDEARDQIQPFSFLDFINYTKVDYSPEEYSTFYTSYIKEWYSTKDLTQEEQVNEFKTFYTNFIKEIVLNFTTESERRFLSKIDFDNPTDLDIALPFYANKIREIVLFYKNKRDEGKYVIDRNKIKGSSSGVERAIFDNVYNFVFGSQDTLSTSGIQLSSIISKLDIDVEEYIDVYGDYFDLPRTPSQETGLRQELYSSNINNIDPDYYFDPDALNVLTNNSLLSSVPVFYINPPAINVDPICDPNNPLAEAGRERTKGGLSPTEVYRLKRQLISKYCGTDFYYVDTTQTTPTSGLLFRSENPTNNLLNLQTADTATVESNQIKLLKDIGLFFKPNKIGLFKLNVDKSEHVIDLDSLEDNQIYIFPDPKSYGNVSTNAQSAYPVSFKYDYRDGIRNISSGVATGDPYITNKQQTFNGYNTKERNSNNLEFLNENGIKFNFSDLYNQGFLQKVQYDIYGNEYGLFKPDSLTEITELEGVNILDLLLDGHLFFDNEEGYNFDYSTVSREGTTIRSGLSTFTNGFSSLESPLLLYFREFRPYQDFQASFAPRNIVPLYRDGAQFTFLNNNLLPDPLPSSDPNWPGTGDYYYSTLVDASSTTFDIRYSLSADGYSSYDCGFFTDDIVVPNDFNYSETYRYIGETDTRFSTQVSTLTSSSSLPTQEERKQLAGKLYVKNQRYSLSYPLSTALEKTLTKYTQSIRDDLNSNLNNFDVVKDVIVLETPSTLILEKISYDDGIFSSSQTNNTIYSVISSDPFAKKSNRFYNEEENKIYFAITTSLDNCLYPRVPEVSLFSRPRNKRAIIPEIYEYDINTNIGRKVFPLDDASYDDVLSKFIISVEENGDSFAPVSVKTPNITYNSTNDLFKITYIILDNNNQTHFCNATFTNINNKIELDSIKVYFTNGIVRTTTFNQTYSTFFASISSTSGSHGTDINDSIIKI